MQTDDETRTVNRTWAEVEDVSQRNQGAKVYNFTVEDNHNYFVGRTNLLAHNNYIPKVADKRLGNIVRDLYKGLRTKNPIGTGSTSDAVRNEELTGLKTYYGKSHANKAKQHTNALQNWLRKNPNASHYDRMVARSLLNDLKEALIGK